MKRFLLILVLFLAPHIVGAQALLNINLATAQELSEQLPGIGEVKAQAIVSYRKAHGNFALIDQLAKVPGIGEGLLEIIRKQIKIK